MRILIACVLLLPFSVFAGSVGTTKTFASGDTLTATDLNGNVSALTAAIDDNDARITTIQTQLPIVVIDGNSQVIGALANISDDTQSIDIFTQQGYLQTGIYFSLGAKPFMTVRFHSSANCSGDGYVDSPNGTVTTAYNSSGISTLYYISKNSLAVSNFAYNSVSDFSGCNVVSGTLVGIGGYWPTILNDSVVTGVTSAPYTLPITLQRAQ